MSFAGEQQDHPSEEDELRAIEIAEVSVDSIDQESVVGTSHDPTTVQPPRKSRSRSADAPLGKVVAADANINPYGADEDEVCGICLENAGVGNMVSLWCCKNLLCLHDAKKIGACPFCREEPLMWNLRVEQV